MVNNDIAITVPVIAYPIPAGKVIIFKSRFSELEGVLKSGYCILLNHR